MGHTDGLKPQQQRGGGAPGYIAPHSAKQQLEHRYHGEVGIRCLAQLFGKGIHDFLLDADIWDSIENIGGISADPEGFPAEFIDGEALRFSNPLLTADAGNFGKLIPELVGVLGRQGQRCTVTGEAPGRRRHMGHQVHRAHDVKNVGVEILARRLLAGTGGSGKGVDIDVLLGEMPSAYSAAAIVPPVDGRSAFRCGHVQLATEKVCHGGAPAEAHHPDLQVTLDLLL